MATESPSSISALPRPSPLSQAAGDKPAFPALPFPRLAAALLSAGLLWLCYFPVAIGWLAWVAVVPLLCLVRSQGRARNIYFAAWAGGLAFFWPVLQWMRVADYRMYFTWAMLATYCSLYFPAAIWLVRRLDRNTAWPLVLSVPVVWTGLEFIRSFLMTGFAWYYLGHTQHAFLPLIQIADIAGVYGISFLVAAANAWVFEILYTARFFRSLFGLAEPPIAFVPGKWLSYQGCAVFLLGAATLFYGFWRLDQEDFKAGPRVALLQGNLDQRIRNQAPTDQEAEKTVLKHYRDLCQLASQGSQPDLIIWPETSFPEFWIDVSPYLDIEKVPTVWRDASINARKELRFAIRMCPGNHLLGVNALFLDAGGQKRKYNSALLLQRDGNYTGRYDKIHRVPFGEYVPLKDWLPFMNRFAPYENDYSIRPGEHLTRLQLGDTRFGVLICFEDTDPALAREYGVEGDDGPAVDFLVSIANDGWFDGTSEHNEHLAICRFRAIECRRAVARAVNMGISAVIDSNGRVLEPRQVLDLDGYKSWEINDFDGRVTELPGARWNDFKKTAGVMGATIPIDQRASLYARVGDWLAWACWLVVGCGLVQTCLAARLGRARKLSSVTRSPEARG